MFPPKFYTNKNIIKISKQMNCGYSFVNYEIIKIYNENHFMEMLEDWKIR
jgi:hypothetical protein